MPLATRLLLGLLLFGLQAHAQVLGWRQVHTTPSSGQSRVTAIEAIPAVPSVSSEKAYACGDFTGNFAFDTGDTLHNSTGRDAFVTALKGGSSWDVQWMLQIASDIGNVRLEDLAICPVTGWVYVCGSYTDEAVFVGSNIRLYDKGSTHGFVAWLDPQKPEWRGAFKTEELEPLHLDLDLKTDIYVSGPGSLVRKYNTAGNIVWDHPELSGTTNWGGLAVSKDPKIPVTYALTRTPSSQHPHEVVLTQIHSTDGSALWSIRMGGEDHDDVGGLDLGPDRDVRVAFSSDNPEVYVGEKPVPGIPLVSATHGIAARINPDGKVVWSTPVALAQGSGSLFPVDLDVDRHGASWIACRLDGHWKFEEILRSGIDDSAIAAIDAAGAPFDFHQSTEKAFENALAVAAPVRSFALLGGSYKGSPSTYEPLSPLPHRSSHGAFIARAGSIPGQALFVFRPNPSGPNPLSLDAIISLLHEHDIQVYVTVRNSTHDIAVSGWATGQKIQLLSDNPNLVFELESFIHSSSVLSDAGWGLHWLNPTPPAVYSNEVSYPYDYPETATPVTAYLIDTAVDNSSGWFFANPLFQIAPTRLIRGSGDPAVSSQFEHGTKVASLIGGPGTGAALGTRIRLEPFDVYPAGAETTSAHLADAVLEAIEHYRNQSPKRPAVLSIPSSSVSPATSFTLKTCIELARDAGIPIVLSAGNAGGDASAYIPAAYGSLPGVMTVGATSTSLQPLPSSNGGPAVGFYAPGDEVRCLAWPSPSPGSYHSFTGTSASCAYATAAAAIHLSTNPWQKPSDIEAAISAQLYHGPSKFLQIPPAGPGFVGNFSTWANFHEATDDPDADDDGDRRSNAFEYLAGSNPHARDAAASPLGFSLLSAQANFTLPISATLLDPSSPGILRDGSTWQLRHSIDLQNWSAPGYSLNIPAADPSGIHSTSFGLPCSPPVGFYRLEIQIAR